MTFLFLISYLTVVDIQILRRLIQANRFSRGSESVKARKVTGKNIKHLDKAIRQNDKTLPYYRDIITHELKKNNITDNGISFTYQDPPWFTQHMRTLISLLLLSLQLLLIYTYKTSIAFNATVMTTFFNILMCYSLFLFVIRENEMIGDYLWFIIRIIRIRLSPKYKLRTYRKKFQAELTVERNEGKTEWNRIVEDITEVANFIYYKQPLPETNRYVIAYTQKGSQKHTRTVHVSRQYTDPSVEHIVPLIFAKRSALLFIALRILQYKGIQL